MDRGAGCDCGIPFRGDAGPHGIGGPTAGRLSVRGLENKGEQADDTAVSGNI
jgi:hypothetical protein